MATHVLPSQTPSDSVVSIDIVLQENRRLRGALAQLQKKTEQKKAEVRKLIAQSLQIQEAALETA